jgi:hypothetical protein
MTVGVQQNLDLGPMGPDGADEVADKAANLSTEPLWLVELAGNRQY